MNKSKKKERLERRRTDAHRLKHQLKHDVAETNGDEQLMQDRGYLPTATPGNWRRMTKTERKMYEEAKRD